MKNIDLVIIGGGPAGMSAACESYNNGINDILIIEREESLGGILKQCIHNGFGLHKFGKELTGPEYANIYEEKILELQIPYLLETMVIDVSSDKIITAVNKADGYFQIQAKAIILAMGCRERAKGALNIAGTRPSGILSAGTAQKYVNIKGYLPGKKVVILGSGDIGLIMARRMTLEGAKVLSVIELLPYSSGLNRNIVQCLNDFDIPLKLSHTVVEIHGKERLNGVTVMAVDENKKPILGTEEFFECDTLLLSCGLIPENELSKSAGIFLDRVTGGALVSQERETSAEGIFACGNVLHVHDLVDFVSVEAEIAGKNAAIYVKNGKPKHKNMKINSSGGIRYTVPQYINGIEETEIYFRVSDMMTNVKISLYDGKNLISQKKKRKVAPGEMETFILTKEMLSKITLGKLSLELTEEVYN